MRKNHWLPALMGAGVLVAAVAVPGAAQLSASPQTGTVATNPALGSADTALAGFVMKSGKVKKASVCPYPPARAPHVDLHGPKKVQRNKSFTLTGKVLVHDCGYAGYRLGLYSQVKGKNKYKLISTSVSITGGFATFTIDGIKASTRYYTIGADPAGGFLDSASKVLKVDVTKHDD